MAEKEYKQAKAALAHYERLLDQARADLASFGREPEGEQVVPNAMDDAKALVRARGSWQHARGVAGFASAGDPGVLDVLKDLVASIEPLVSG